MAHRLQSVTDDEAQAFLHHRVAQFALTQRPDDWLVEAVGYPPRLIVRPPTTDGRIVSTVFHEPMTVSPPSLSTAIRQELHGPFPGFSDQMHIHLAMCAEAEESDAGLHPTSIAA